LLISGEGRGEMIVMGKQYADMRGVSAATVSAWIKRGKLTGAAVTGRGRIVVEVADAQLRETLDPFRGRPAAVPDTGASHHRNQSEETQRAVAAVLEQGAADYAEMIGHIEEFISASLERAGAGAELAAAVRVEFRRTWGL
jgi:predicted site-specific integrase-resolvase